MLFGQSVFQSVLDRLDMEEAAAEEADAPAAHRIQGLNSSFAVNAMEGVSTTWARPDQAYVDNLGFDMPPGAKAAQAGDAPQPAAASAPEPVVEEPEPVMPAHLARTAPQDVAAELAITSKDTPHSLNEKRRAFAKVNHPDSIAAPFRDKATIRMKIANLLIDEALKRLAIAARLSL
jgi:type IV secretory pathway VirB10-like protein